MYDKNSDGEPDKDQNPLLDTVKESVKDDSGINTCNSEVTDATHDEAKVTKNLERRNSRRKIIQKLAKSRQTKKSNKRRSISE